MLSSWPLQAATTKLQGRVGQLELQLASYDTLLQAAEGVAVLPRVAGGSPSSGGRRGAGGSPIQAAISALQLRKAAKEAEEARQQLAAARADLASLRR